MTRASYLESARVMPLGARSMAWICAAEWSDLSPPLTPEAVVRDVGNGFVSRHSAHDDYGVVIDATGAVDLPASKALRRQMRGDRARTEVPHVIRVRPGNNDLGRVA